MKVTVVGMETEVKEVQEEKAAFSMADTDVGMETEVREEQETKALLPMAVTVVGI